MFKSKKIIFLIFIIALTSSCVSVKKHNARLETPIAPKLLRSDVDFTYRKLQKLHPNLYWYISKNELDYKMDSLKKSIKKPLKPFQFYEKLAPVLANIKEGHLRLSIPEKKFTKDEIKKLENQKGLFSRMNYVVEGDRLFVKDNAAKFENIAVGTEILAIQDEPVADYLKRYRTYINSDGNNATFQKYALARRWATYFTIENGILDSVKIQTKLNGVIKELYVNREQKTKIEKKAEVIEKKLVNATPVNKVKDYNIVTKDFNRKLSYLDKDSSIAYMKIATFSGTYSRTFYKQSFKSIKNAKSKYLILDVRDNLGGSLSEIHNLYSYLTNEDFQFIKDIEVASFTSMHAANYYKEFPRFLQPVAALVYPVYFLGTLLSVKKHNDKFLLRNNNIFTYTKPKKDAFHGKVYVIVNGSSFSASSIIAAKIKGDKRGIIVGEETGGTNDGTVAGRYATVVLPHSKLKLPIGLMLIQPNIKLEDSKRGVLPDVEITKTTLQILQKKDLELDWIIKDINIQKNAN